MLFLHYF